MKWDSIAKLSLSQNSFNFGFKFILILQHFLTVLLIIKINFTLILEDMWIWQQIILGWYNILISDIVICIMVYDDIIILYQLIDLVYIVILLVLILNYIKLYIFRNLLLLFVIFIIHTIILLIFGFLFIKWKNLCRLALKQI